MKPFALFTRALTLCAGTALLSACATRPDIRDTTGYNAFHIAQAIRCEVRDSIIDIIAEAVEDAGKYYQDQQVHYHAEAERLRRRDTRTENSEDREAERFEVLFANAKAVFMQNERRHVKSDEMIASLVRYADAAVAYDFELNLRQTNNTGASIDLLGTLTRGTLTASPGASFMGKREAIRSFRLLDTFRELLTNRPTIRVCNDLRNRKPELRRPNGVYPVAGNLRLDRVIREFVSFNQSANLVGGEGTPDVPTMAETVEFTTTFSAGVEPELKLTPFRHGTVVTGAKLTLNAERYDRHKVILTFTLPPRAGSVAQERSETERAAVNELDRQRDLQLDNDARQLWRVILNR